MHSLTDSVELAVAVDELKHIFENKTIFYSTD